MNDDTVYYPLSVLDSLMSEQEVAHACGPDAEHCSCVLHLRAEIERLRAQRVLDNEEAARLYDFARDKGQALERAAVVAWLRAECGSPGHEDRFCAYCNVRRNIAAAIERGEHRREEER
jgi:hypothetical protein